MMATWMEMLRSPETSRSMVHRIVRPDKSKAWQDLLLDWLR